MRGMGWLRGGAAQPQCSKSPSTGALSIRWPWNSRRESTLLGLRVLLSKRDASLPSQSRARRWLCQHSKAPLAGQLLAEQGVLSGSQIRRQQLSIPFYECQADGEKSISCFFLGAAAVCSTAGEGCPCPAWAGESLPAFSSGDAEVAALQRLGKCPFCLRLHQPTV